MIFLFSCGLRLVNQPLVPSCSRWAWRPSGLLSQVQLRRAFLRDPWQDDDVSMKTTSRACPHLAGDEVPAGKAATAVLHVGGLGWASEKAVVARALGRRPGVRLVEANPVSQTATVTFDTAQTSVAELRRWVEECGYHCAG
jgi:copper chaperone CopZ